MCCGAGLQCSCGRRRTSRVGRDVCFPRLVRRTSRHETARHRAPLFTQPSHTYTHPHRPLSTSPAPRSIPLGPFVYLTQTYVYASQTSARPFQTSAHLSKTYLHASMTCAHPLQSSVRLSQTCVHQSPFSIYPFQKNSLCNCLRPSSAHSRPRFTRLRLFVPDSCMSVSELSRPFVRPSLTSVYPSQSSVHPSETYIHPPTLLCLAILGLCPLFPDLCSSITDFCPPIPDLCPPISYYTVCVVAYASLYPLSQTSVHPCAFLCPPVPDFCPLDPVLVDCTPPCWGSTGSLATPFWVM